MDPTGILYFKGVKRKLKSCVQGQFGDVRARKHRERNPKTGFGACSRLSAGSPVDGAPQTHLEQRPYLPVDEEDRKVLVPEAFADFFAVEALEKAHREEEDEERDRSPVQCIASVAVRYGEVYELVME